MRTLAPCRHHDPGRRDSRGYSQPCKRFPKLDRAKCSEACVGYKPAKGDTQLAMGGAE